MTTDLGERASYAVAKARHRWRRWRGHGDPTVVFSMAKTGSSSVADALRRAGEASVFQVHDLNEGFLEEEEAEYRWSGRPWRIWDARVLLRHPPTTARPWRVVSIVRDPIAQSVSAFFQPGARRGYLREGASLEELHRRFGDRLDHLPLHWFESHLRPALGIDVYATGFDAARGYGIVATPKLQLLLLRCEDLGTTSIGLGELLGRDRPVPIPQLNVGSDKHYADLYQAFRRSLRPTATQLDRAYGSRLVRHFYTSDEIDRFRSLWSDPPADAETAR